MKSRGDEAGAATHMRGRIIVPKATVVITRRHKATHYSVALQYEYGMKVPICVATDGDALAIRATRSRPSVYWWKTRWK